MKIEDLEVGKLYTCVLSNQKVLNILAEVKTNEDSEETKSIKSGKVCVMREGVPSFSLMELHDGQLKE